MLDRYHYISRIAKISIVAAIIICSAILFFNNKSDNISISVQSKAPTTNSEINVENSVFSSKGDNSYRIFAENISKASGENYDLEKISGIYNLDNKENISINAINCAVNNENDSLILKNDVKIGYENYLMITEKMHVDLTKKAADSDKHVMVMGTNGIINADEFKTNEDFCEVVFKGNVKAHFNLASPK